MLYRLAAVAGSGEAAPDYLFDGASGLRAQRPGFNFRNTPHPADGTKRTLLEDALQPQPPPAAESQPERAQTEAPVEKAPAPAQKTKNKQRSRKQFLCPLCTALLKVCAQAFAFSTSHIQRAALHSA